MWSIWELLAVHQYRTALYKCQPTSFRSGFRATATSKMERFVIIVNGFQPLIIMTKCFILDVTAVLDPLWVSTEDLLHKNQGIFFIRRNINKVDSIETRRIVIAHLLPWSDLEKLKYTTLFQFTMIKFYRHFLIYKYNFTFRFNFNIYRLKKRYMS